MDKNFRYQIDDQSIELIRPTSHTLGISENIQDKIHINKIELARYILYYSQNNYKEEKHIDYTYFENLEFENLVKFFCEYVNSDEDLLKSFSIQEVYDIETGVGLIIKHREKFGIKMGTIFTLGSISLESDRILLNAIEGNFDEIQSEKIKIKWNNFRKNILPKLSLDDDTGKLANHTTQFLNDKADIIIKYAKITSLMVKGLEVSKIWIPNRLITEITKEFLKIESEKIGLRYLPNLIFKLIDKEYLDKIKSDLLRNEWFADRSKIIDEMFENLYKKHYHSIISLGLTQIDYLVFEIFSYYKKSKKNKYTNSKMIDSLLDNLEIIKGKMTINKFMPFDSKFEEGLRIIQFITLTNYLINHLFKNYDFYKDKVGSRELNRHAILHGKIHDYGTYENAVRIIVLIDDLLYFFKYYIISNKNLT